MGEVPLVRMARSVDTEGLLRLWLDLIEYHRRLDPEFPALHGLRALLLQEIERGLRSSDCCLGVAELRTELVGFVFAGLKLGAQTRRGKGGGGWIHELYVDHVQELKIHAGLLGHSSF